MTDGKVPPHITISAFQSLNEEKVLSSVEKIAAMIKSDTITWVSVGQFLPYVVFLSPVLCKYLHDMSSMIYEEIKQIDQTIINPYYMPFQWFPHTTIGKKLSQEEMQIACQVLHSEFSMFSGRVTRIGLAKTNPYTVISEYILNSEVK